MSVIRITEAPLHEQMLFSDMMLQKVWLQFFGDVHTSLEGYWGRAVNALDMGAVSVDPVDGNIDQLIETQGKVIHVRIKLDGVIGGGSVTIPPTYKVLDGTISYTEVNSGVVGSIKRLFVESSSFIVPLPDDSEASIFIEGTLIRATGE